MAAQLQYLGLRIGHEIGYARYDQTAEEAELIACGVAHHWGPLLGHPTVLGLIMVGHGGTEEGTAIWTRLLKLGPLGIERNDVLFSDAIHVN